MSSSVGPGTGGIVGMKPPSGGGGTYAAPTCSAISPASGALAGGNSVTVTGTGFRANMTITIGGVACTNINLVNTTTATCVTGGHSAGAVNVVVTNSDAQAGTLTNGFTYNAFPTISSLSVASGSTSGGTSTQINGTGFLSGATVTIGGVAATSVVVASSIAITCVTPAGSGTANVVVTNTDGQSVTSVGAYTYTNWANSKSILFASASSQYIDYGNNIGDEYNSALSWTFWINMSSTAGARTVISKIGSANVGYFIFVYNGSVSWFMSHSGANALYVEANSDLLSTGTWYFIAVTSDGSGTAAGTKIYINGSSKTLLTDQNNLTLTVANSLSLTMGCDLSGASNAPNEFFSGNIAQVAHWNTALSSGNITTLYNSGTPVDVTAQSFSSSCDHFWPMGTPSDSIAAGGILDRVGSVHGTPVNTPVISSTVPP